MKMSLNHEIPVQLKDYEGLKNLLKLEPMSKASVQRILKADPKFAAYFRSQK